MSAALALRAPRQARSVESFRRMLDAAEAVMEEKSFDQATIGEIVERAGLTVGAFYSRFADKEALLSCLEERMAAEVSANADTIDGALRAGEPVEAVLRRFLAGLVRFYHRRRAVARALVIRSHSDPELRARLEKLNHRNMLKVSRFLAARAPRGRAAGQHALEFALLAMRCVLRETVLFHETFPGRRPLTEEELTEQLTRLMLAHLGLAARIGARPAPGRKKGRPS